MRPKTKSHSPSLRGYWGGLLAGVFGLPSTLLGLLFWWRARSWWLPRLGSRLCFVVALLSFGLCFVVTFLGSRLALVVGRLCSLA